MTAPRRHHPRRALVLALCATAALLWLQLPARPTAACGAMVFEQHDERLGGMSGQEVALLVTPTVTRLVVSAGYVDNTGDFAFLLPVGAGPDEVVDGDPRLFYALDEGLAPRITIVDYTSPSSDGGGGGCGCGAADAGGGAGGEQATNVVVVQRGQTDTYDYVVVGASGETSVADWLSAEGFAVPQDYAAAIDTYVGDGWLFLAARVRPDAGERDGVLAPLELAFPGTTADNVVIPFGISAWSLPPDGGLGITLYVLSDGGAAPANYDVVGIASSDVAATSPTTSNYAQVFDSALAGVSDGAFVLEARRELLGYESLSGWVEAAMADGTLPEGLPATARTVADFEADARTALGGPLRIARFRTRLMATQLRDLQLETAAFTEVSDSYYLEWYGSSSAAGDDAGVEVGAFWVGLLAIGFTMGAGLRRRVRGR